MVFNPTNSRVDMCAAYQFSTGGLGASVIVVGALCINAYGLGIGIVTSGKESVVVNLGHRETSCEGVANYLFHWCVLSH